MMRNKRRQKHLVLPAAILIFMLVSGTVSASAEAIGREEAAGAAAAVETGNVEETAGATAAVETEKIEETDGAEQTEKVKEDALSGCSPWAVEEISRAIEEGLVPEHLQCDYQQPVTRGELTELAAYYELWHEPEGTTFKEMWAKEDERYAQGREQYGDDLDRFPYYRENVFTDTNEELFNRMYQFHYISGYPDGTFRPDENITRAEAAVLLWSVLREYISGGYMTAEGWYTQAVYQFKDIDAIPEWSEYYVAWMWYLGCIKGYSETIYGPEDLMTREQAIAAVMRMAKRW